MEHRDLLSSVAQLPDLLDPSVVSVLVVTGVGFHRYPGVLITIALHVLGLGVECVAVDIVRLIGLRLCSAPCDKANMSCSSAEESSCKGYDRSFSLNQSVKHELCSLSISPSVLCWPRLLYIFLIKVLCSTTQGSTMSMCCSATRFALSKSASRPSKSTCISRRPSR